MSVELKLELMQPDQVVQVVEDKFEGCKAIPCREEVMVAAERFAWEIVIPNLRVVENLNICIPRLRIWEDKSRPEHELYLEIVKDIKPNEKVTVQKIGAMAGIQIGNELLKRQKDAIHMVNNVAGTNHEVQGDPEAIEASMVKGSWEATDPIKFSGEAWDKDDPANYS